jgi:hypothetical protein
MNLSSGRSEVCVLKPWGQYNNIPGQESLWASNERVSSYQQLCMLLYELIAGRTSERPRPNEYGWQD